MIAVLDYGIGNLRSAEKALQQVGADARLVTDPADAEGADGVVLPGVGAFGRCMEALRDSGLDAVALDAIDAGRPFLGICIGMQMLYEGSDEIPGARAWACCPVGARLLPDGVKRPQMQWNRARRRRAAGRCSRLASTPSPGSTSSTPTPRPSRPTTSSPRATTAARSWPRSSADNVWATQFHPEKSGATGLRLLANFVDAAPVGRRT